MVAPFVAAADLYRLHGQHSAGDGTQCQRRAVRRHHGLYLLGPDGAAAGAINAKYYGWRVALYIAGIMYICNRRHRPDSALRFRLLGIAPESARAVADVAQFKLDYTFWLNLVFLAVTGWLIFLHRRHLKEQADGGMDHGGNLTVKRVVVYLFMVILAGGLVAFTITSGTG